MPELPDVIPGATIQTARANQIRDRAVMRYASAAARDASVLVPVSGDLAWLENVQRLTIYNGTIWDDYYPGPHLDFGGHFAVAAPGTEDLTGTNVAWPSNLAVMGTVPAGVNRITATAVVSQALALTADVNHTLGLTLDGTTLITPTRARLLLDQFGDISVSFGTQVVVPGNAFELRVRGTRVSGIGALRITNDKVSYIDYRFGVV